ncbi:M56 family metallopeptidase [Seonamhaeicola maritimus]|uniref:M56 family metallopeptidase n=1 Tax=Seonamhaeicola maritimus TaxID=2591822 RepID=UPI002494FCBF|nr:M56 family metallopeptidase [Seonamhaeicola maritimus]
MEYLLKASAVLAIFYLCYKLFLQRDTFFESNRGFLLMGLISAFLIPLVVIPVYVERAPILIDNFIIENAISVTQPLEETISLLDILLYSYIAGVVFFLCRFLIQLISLVTILIKHESIKKGRFTYVRTHKNATPFSFFNWIVYNPELFNKTELEQVLTHEKVHARQHHSIDILLTQLACIVLWFNPFMWLYNKDLKQNLEFIADQNAQQKSNCKKSYQYTLLKTSMPTHQLALTNNFYNSLIKKRIVMLHKSKSKKSNLLKYALVIPILVIFLMSFNTKEIFVDAEVVPEENYLLDAYESDENLFIENPVVEEGNQEKPVASAKKDIEIFLINKDFSDEGFDKLTDKLKKKGITAKFKGIKRNSSGEITAIKINISSKHSNANYSINGDEPIKPIKISFEDNGKSISIGNSSHHSSAYFISKDGTHEIEHDNNVFVISDDDDPKTLQEIKVIGYANDKHNTNKKIHIVNGDTLKWKSKKGENHFKIRKNTNVEVIGYGDDKKIEVIGYGNDKKNVKVIIESDDDDLINKDEDVIIIRKNDDDDDDDDKKDKSVKVRKVKSGNVLFVGDEDGKDPLFIVDGKEVDKDKIEGIDSDKIKTVFVLKGEQATEKYGDKGKDGVIIITTKDKDKSPPVLKLSGKARYFIDGKESKENVLESLDPDDIESIDVLKGEHAINKYGLKGKDGVIIITTKTSKSKWNVNTGIKLSNGKNQIVGKNPLYIIDGKESTVEVSKDLLPDDIEKIEVLKDESAIKKYGDKGKNGVILITTKK